MQLKPILRGKKNGHLFEMTVLKKQQSFLTAAFKVLLNLFQSENKTTCKSKLSDGTTGRYSCACTASTKVQSATHKLHGNVEIGLNQDAHLRRNKNLYS